jgi:uncharacterized delta-60 repeat protein
MIISSGLFLRGEAAPGNLDTTFSSDGRQTSDFLSGVDYDRAAGVAVQSNGKIVVVGTADPGGGNEQFALARYNDNGTLDTTFSGDGKKTTDFPGGRDLAYAVALQSDGKIVVAGQTVLSSTNSDFEVARYNIDGSLDDGTANDSTPGDSFGTGGRQTTDFFGKQDIASSVAIQPNGKIVVGGLATNAGGDFAVARYNSDGAPDITFSSDGKLTTDFGTSSDVALSIAIQANNKIVAAGGINNSGIGSARKFALARYTGTGALDTTFSGDGKLTTTFMGGSAASSVAMQGDSKIVAAGSAYTDSSNSESDFALARYNGNGSLDDGTVNDSTSGDSFGTGGKVTTNFFGGFDGANAVAIQSNGKIVAAGGARQSDGSNPDFALARYTSDGTPDTTFSGDGKRTVGFFNGSRDEGKAIAIQTNGKIVVAGSADIFNGRVDFAVARFIGD